MFPITVPNVLTVLRILLVPDLIVALLDETPNGDLLAAIVFAVASLTDAIDGYLARSRQWVTTFGKLMDPVADKLLVIGALLALVSLNRVAAWVAMVVITREFVVTALRIAATGQGVIIPAGVFGKAKTVMQVGMVFALIVVEGSPAWLDGLVYATVVVTVASGIDYVFGIRRSLARARAARGSAAG